MAHPFAASACTKEDFAEFLDDWKAGNLYPDVY
jgi:hypothetical protein